MEQDRGTEARVFYVKNLSIGDMIRKFGGSIDSDLKDFQ